MVLKLYDLAGKQDELRFSPNCWRVKLALKHKGLQAEEIPWRFTERDAIAFSGQKLVPILVDNDTTVTDSWEIARYLETAYSDRPSLFGGAVGEAEALFIKFWCEQTINPIIFQIILLDLFQHVHEKDQEYFRQSRETRLGMSLEEFAQPSDEMIATLKKALAPLRATVDRQPYLGGATATFADYVVFSTFLWARAVSPIQLLTSTDPVYQWRDRLLDAFDRYARQAPGYAV